MIEEIINEETTFTTLGKDNIKIKKDFSCPNCGKEYKSVGWLKNHMNTCMDGNSTTKQKTKPTVVVKTQVKKKKPKEVVKVKVNVIHKCTSCKNEFKTEKQFDNHKCIPITYKCDKCNKEYKQKASLANHKCSYVIKKDPTIVKNKKFNFKCVHCKKGFMNEDTLLTHSCTAIERLAKMGDRESRIAFLGYTQLYSKTTSHIKKAVITENDFVKSRLYEALIKFGKYAVGVGMYDVNSYITFLVKNNVKVIDWCNDDIYYLYISHVSLNETPDAAIEKTFRTMRVWSEDTSLPWIEYFNMCNQFKIVSSIKNGKISPWVIYNTTSGKNFLRSLDKKQLKDLYKFVDPDKWMVTFNKRSDDIKVIVTLFNKAGL